MPNPEFNTDRGPCQDCKSYGGIANQKLGDTVCTTPEKSGKSISRMPECGCSAFERRPGTTGRAVSFPKGR